MFIVLDKHDVLDTFTFAESAGLLEATLHFGFKLAVCSYGTNKIGEFLHVCSDNRTAPDWPPVVRSCSWSLFTERRTGRAASCQEDRSRPALVCPACGSLRVGNRNDWRCPTCGTVRVAVVRPHRVLVSDHGKGEALLRQLDPDDQMIFFDDKMDNLRDVTSAFRGRARGAIVRRGRKAWAPVEGDTSGEFPVVRSLQDVMQVI